MRVVIVEPGQYPRIEELELTLQKEQQIVGWLIDVIYPWEEMVGVICNDEGILLHLPHNRVVERYGPICGAFIVVGLGEEDFCGLTEEQARRYSRMFHSPEILFDFAGTPRLYRCSPDEYKRIMDAVNGAKDASRPRKPRQTPPGTDRER